LFLEVERARRRKSRTEGLAFGLRTLAPDRRTPLPTRAGSLSTSRNRENRETTTQPMTPPGVPSSLLVVETGSPRGGHPGAPPLPPPRPQELTMPPMPTEAQVTGGAPPRRPPVPKTPRRRRRKPLLVCDREGKILFVPAAAVMGPHAWLIASCDG